MNTINRIKCLRKLHGLSQTLFAEKYNVAQTAVSNWEQFRNSIDIGTASKIAADYKVPVEFVYGFEFEVTRPKSEWSHDQIEDMTNAHPCCKDFFLFRYGKGRFATMLQTAEQPSQESKGIRIPVYGKVAAGIPMEAITDIEDYEEISEDLARTGEFAALKIKGDSMEPRMMDGDVVIVRIQNTIENGEIAVVMVNGDAATCKKIKKTPEGVMLVPINPSHEPMFYSNKEIEQLPVRIFGKVVELRAKFR